MLIVHSLLIAIACIRDGDSIIPRVVGLAAALFDVTILLLLINLIKGHANNNIMVFQLQKIYNYETVVHGNTFYNTKKYFLRLVHGGNALKVYFRTFCSKGTSEVFFVIS